MRLKYTKETRIVVRQNISQTYQTKKVPSGETVFALGSGKVSFFFSGSGDGFFSTVKITNFNVLWWEKWWSYDEQIIKHWLDKNRTNNEKSQQ